MEIFATFDVLDQGGSKVAEGHKASFCLEDNQCIDDTRPFFACSNYGNQGISVNCSDIYQHNIDCQWIDISELNPGLYIFKVLISYSFTSFVVNAAFQMLILSISIMISFLGIN